MIPSFPTSAAKFWSPFISGRTYYTYPSDCTVQYVLYIYVVKTLLYFGVDAGKDLDRSLRYQISEAEISGRSPVFVLLQYHGTVVLRACTVQYLLYVFCESSKDFALRVFTPFPKHLFSKTSAGQVQSHMQAFINSRSIEYSTVSTPALVRYVLPITHRHGK